MSSTQKLYDAMIQQLQASITRAQTPGTYELGLQTDYNNLNNFINSKDYRNPTAAGVSIPMLSLSQYQQQQKEGQPSNLQGVDPTSAANQNKVSADELAQNYGGAYEQQVGSLSDQRTGMQQQLQSLYDQRMGIGAQGYQGALQGLAAQPQPYQWQNLIPGIAGSALGLGQMLGNQQQQNPIDSNMGTDAPPSWNFSNTPPPYAPYGVPTPPSYGQPNNPYGSTWG